MKRALIVLGSFLWGIVVFRIAFGIHFPSEIVQNRIAVEVAKSSKDSMQLKIGDIGPTSLMGLQVNDAILYKQNEEGESIPTIVLDQLSVVLSPLQTLFGSLGASIDANILGGTIIADVVGDSFQPKEFDITIDSTELDLSSVPIESSTFEASLAGKVSSHIEGVFPQELPHKNSEGRFTISVDGLSISNATASGIELPSLDFSEANIAGLVKNGKLEITDANFISESIGLSIDGDIILGKVWKRSRLRLTLELKLGSEFALIAKMLPALKNNKVGEEDGQGIYKLNVIGTIKNPRIKSSNRNNSRRPNRASPSRNKEIEDNDVKSATETKSPDEKRKERRERIEARKRAQDKRRKAGAVDLPDNPRRRDTPNRPLQRVPSLEPDDELEDEDLEPGDEDLEPGDEEGFDGGEDDEDEPSDEPSDDE